MRNVIIPEKEFIREHKRLIKELHQPNTKKLKKEAILQQKELKNYIKKTYGASF